MQAEADARERHWQSQVSGLQSKVEKLESLLQREMGHHQIASPTPRPVYDISPVGPGWHLCTLCQHLCIMHQHTVFALTGQHLITSLEHVSAVSITLTTE